MIERQYSETLSKYIPSNKLQKTEYTACKNTPSILLSTPVLWMAYKAFLL